MTPQQYRSAVAIATGLTPFQRRTLLAVADRATHVCTPGAPDIADWPAGRIGPTTVVFYTADGVLHAVRVGRAKVLHEAEAS